MVAPLRSQLTSQRGGGGSDGDARLDEFYQQRSRC
jgi:hypothetical protein